MKKIVLIMALGFLAACGADGAPMQPSAFLGLSFGSDGVSPRAGIGASNGNVGVGVSL